MFASYVQALKSRLHGLLHPQAIRALIDTLCKADQQLDHRGPITLTTSGEQAALTVANNLPSQNAIQTNGGHVIFGPQPGTFTPPPPGNPSNPMPAAGPLNPIAPAGAAQTDQLVVNNSATFNNYATHNYPATFNDDVRMGMDLILKYLTEGMGSTIARIQLTGSVPLTPGQIGTAVVLNASGKQALTNVSGQGGGQIPVKLSPCFGSVPSSVPCQTYPAGSCGYAIYFSDTTVNPDTNEYDPAFDGSHRGNLGSWWEIITITPAGSAPQTTLTYVTDVKICCASVNGSQVIVSCTRTSTITICAQTVSSADNGWGSCPCS